MRKSRLKNYRWHISLMTLVLFCLSLLPTNFTVVGAEELQKLKIRFVKADGNYENWNIWTWWEGQTGKEINFDYQDEEGVYALVEVPKNGELGYIIKKGNWVEKATGNVMYDLSEGEKEFIVTYGQPENPQSIEKVELYKDLSKLSVSVHYNRPNGDYDDWNLWNWIPGVNEGNEAYTPGFNEKDDFGKIATFEYENLSKESKSAAFIIRTNDWAKDGEDRFVDLAYADCKGHIDVYVNQGDNNVYYTVPEKSSESVDDSTNISSRVPVLVGNLQDEVSKGTETEWNPASTVTVFKELGDSFYSLTATLPAGEYEYKVAFGSWDESYGENGGQTNIKLTLTEEREVTFYYSDKTHLPTDSTKYTPVYSSDKQPRLAGTIQSAIGEASDWSPSESTIKLYDHNFNGIYSVDLKAVPKGEYEFKVTIGGSLDESYGDGSENCKLSVPDTCDVNVTFDSNSKEITTKVAAPVVGEFDGQVNSTALYHNTWDSIYKYPFGAVAEGTEVTVRLHAEKDDLQYARVLVRNNNNNRSDLVNMEKISTLTLEDGTEVDIWEATFTPDEMGVYGYKFIVGDGDTVKYYGEDGNEGKVGVVGDKNCPFFQLTVYDEGYKTPDWMKEAVVCQIFTDRFNNGDKSNDNAKSNARGNEPIESHDDWNELPDNPRIAESSTGDVTGPYNGDSIWSNDFFGGDIKGIQEKLDYLQGLGINTLYLNPIAMAASNHKYDASDFKKLDPMFGTEADFKSFTKELESRGMKLIVDGVFNHVGDDSVYFDRYGKYETVGAYEYWSYVYDLMNKDGISQEDAMLKADKYFVNNGQKFSEEKWHLWFNIKNSKINVGTTNERYEYQSWWGYDSLPEFKSMSKEEAIEFGLANENDEFVTKLSEWNNKALVNYIYKADDSVAKQWINWGADGWRLDVANEVDTIFWNDFREEMKAHNSETLILGEIWDDASKYFIGDQYDSVMNYRIRAGLIDYLKNGKAERLDDTLMAIYEDYPKEAFYALMNLMGSHDVARAQYVLGGGVDTVERAEFGTYDSELGKKRLKLAALFEFGYPGAPTIYYGDEAGVTGTKDPDNRRTYPWGNEDEALIDFYELIGQVRNENKALFAHGDLVTLYSADGIYVYGRSFNGKYGIVAINPTESDATVTLDLQDFTGNGTEFIDGLMEDYKVTVKNGKVDITIPSLTGRMMTSSNVVNLPQSVTGLKVTEGSESVALEWNSVDGASSYKVYSSPFKGSLESEVLTVNENKANITGLVNGQKLYFAVSVIDGNGNESLLSWTEEVIPHSEIEWSGNLSDITIDKVDISNPLEVNAEARTKNGSSDGLVARLLVKYPGESEFSVFKATYKGEVGNNYQFTANFIPTKAGEYEYKYEFTTKESYGFNDESSIVSTETKTFTLNNGDDVVPADSIVLETPEQQSGEVNLKWSITGNNNIAIYEIVRNGVVIARLQNKEAVSYKDTDVRNKTEYKYQVIGYSNGGNEVKSNEESVTPDLVMVEVTFKLKAPSYTPLDAKVTMPGAMNGWSVDAWEMSRNGAVTTDWTYTVSVLEGEQIEYKYVKGGGWEQEALMKYTNPKAAIQSAYGCTTGEGGNEKITVVNQGDGKMLVENEVVRWKDMPVVILDPATGSTTKNDTITVKGNAMLDPNLTINGEQVLVDENGNFAHEVKLADGKNDIKIHIEPTEENKNNPDIFNNNEEAIGYATKDLTLEITKIADGEDSGEENPGEDDNKPSDGENNPGDEKPSEGEDKPGNNEEDNPTVDVEPQGGNNSDGNNGSSNNESTNNGIVNTGGTNTAYFFIIGLVLVCAGATITLKRKEVK